MKSTMGPERPPRTRRDLRRWWRTCGSLESPVAIAPRHLDGSAVPLVFCGSIAPIHRPIVTARLVVRCVQPEDRAAVAATIDDEVRRANGWTPGNEVALLRAVAEGYGADLGRLVVCDRAGSVLGELQVQPHLPGDAWELGWWIGSAHRGQGLATEAVRAAVDRCHDLGIREVTFGTRADNVAVCRIAASVGAVVGSRGTHRLPDGSTPETIWFVHERADVPAG